MALGNGGGSFTPTSAWMVANFFSAHIFGPTIVFAALPLLSMLLALGTSAASFFRELSPGLIIWRRSASIAGLVIQAVLSFLMVVIYSFGFHFGGGFWVTLLGFVVIMVGTLLN